MLVTVEPKDFGQVAILGDLHGDHKALIALLELVDLSVDLLVFLGDYADRGANGIEVIRKVNQLRQDNPKNVVALLGNHEDYSGNGEPLFNPCTLISEARSKLGSWDTYFDGELKPFLDSLPLCAIVPNNALLVHGGVSSKIHGIGDLRSPSVALRADLLWSDPLDGNGEYSNYIRGVGVEWGKDVSKAVCQTLGVERIIRSHQPQLAATKPFITHGGRVITVNATSVYGGLPFVYFVDPLSAEKDVYRSAEL